MIRRSIVELVASSSITLERDTAMATTTSLGFPLHDLNVTRSKSWRRELNATQQHRLVEMRRFWHLVVNAKWS